MFGTIVVGVDASGHADHAVQTVAKMAAATGDKVVVHGVVVHLAKAGSRSDLASMVLGSVAHEAVHKSPAPVLVTPERS